jgi:hypothetical protein
MINKREGSITKKIRPETPMAIIYTPYLPYIIFYNLSTYKFYLTFTIGTLHNIQKNLATISHNVPAVTDVFLRPTRKNAKHFYGRKKMWRSKTPQRALARLVFCVA